MSSHNGYTGGSGVWHTFSDTSSIGKQPEDANPELHDDVEALDELSGPRSWLHPAVASAIFCFLPTGIIAVIQARKAMKAYESGDLHSWVRYTSRARFLVFITCFLGLIVYGAIIGIVKSIKHTSNG